MLDSTSSTEVRRDAVLAQRSLTLLGYDNLHFAFCSKVLLNWVKMLFSPTEVAKV